MLRSSSYQPLIAPRPDRDSDHVCPDPRDFSPPPLFSPVHRNAGAKFHGQRTTTARAACREDAHLLPGRGPLLRRPWHPRDPRSDPLPRKTRDRMLYHRGLGANVLWRWARSRCTLYGYTLNNGEFPHSPRFGAFKALHASGKY